MKKLSIVTIIAAFVSIGAVSIAPAKATNLTKVDYNGSFNAEIKFPIPLPSLNLSKEVNASDTIDNLSGRLSDSGDSELTIEQPFSFLSPELKNILDSNQIKIDSWNGSGSISNESGFLSDFNFEYNKSSDVLIIKDYIFTNIESCLNSTCKLKGEGNFSGSSTKFGSLPVSGKLGFDIDQTATPLPVPQPLPVGEPQSVPEPSLLLGFISLVGLFAAKPKPKKISLN